MKVGDTVHHNFQGFKFDFTCEEIVPSSEDGKVCYKGTSRTEAANLDEFIQAIFKTGAVFMGGNA
jgi:hypothetical protein